MSLKNIFIILTVIACANNLKMSHHRHDINSHSAKPDSSKPDSSVKLFHNGTIITMKTDNKTGRLETVEVVAVENGTIIHTGSYQQILQHLNKQSKTIINVDLKGNTMMPGFYDAHSHFGSNAMMVSQGFNILSPPMGNVQNIPTLLQNVKDYVDKHPNKSQTIFGLSFNDLGLAQNRFPTRYELDWISPDYLICLMHISMHACVCNSKVINSVPALSSNISDQTSLQIQQNETIITYKNGTLTGTLKQIAGMYYVLPLAPKINAKKVLEGQAQYLSAGYTTAHDYFTPQAYEPAAYHELGDKLILDIRGYLIVDPIHSASVNLSQYQNYTTQKFKMQGIKIVLDGSIQAYTAFLQKPYYKQPAGEKNYSGFSACPNQEILNDFMLKLYKNQNDTLVHCNGDGASKQFIDAVQNAYHKQPDIQRKNRIVMIHAQTITEEQLDRMSSLKINPSFFPSHTYFWGQDHYNIFLGPERASRIDPAKSALDRKLRFTLHNDAPVTPVMPDGVFRIIWSAVNRIMYNSTVPGKVLGKQQRIPVEQALKSVTIHAAWQAHEGKLKGSIQKGKFADFIVVDKNPLEIDPVDLVNIKVLKTYKNGKKVFEL